MKEALTLLQQRFADIDHDGPAANAHLLAPPRDEQAEARLRQEAVATGTGWGTGLRSRSQRRRDSASFTSVMSKRAGSNPSPDSRPSQSKLSACSGCSASARISSRSA